MFSASCERYVLGGLEDAEGHPPRLLRVIGGCLRSIVIATQLPARTRMYSDGYIGMGLARNELMTPSVKRVGLRSPFFARRMIFFATDVAMRAS
jgi:hypothetical protein